MDAGSCAVGISLSDLLLHRRFFKATDIRVSSCCTNPSLCREGDLFVATVTADEDGHEGVEEASRRGIAGVLCERILPVDIPQCIVPNAKSALATICHRLAGSPSTTLPTVGIAGADGLTVCALLFERVLEAAGYLPASFNELNYSTGLGPIPRISSSLTAAQHAQWLGNAVANGCSHGVLELPRQDVLNHTFDATELNALMLTHFSSPISKMRLSEAHQVYFQRVLDSLSEDGLLVVNIDCPINAELLRYIERPALTVSAKSRSADVTATLLESHPSEQTFTIRAGYDTAAVRTRIIGEAQIQACLLATAAGLSQGIDLTTIIAALESLETVPGHLERVECGQPFSVYADGCTSPTELQRSLSAVRKVTKGRLLCVLGPGPSRNAKVRWRRGQIAERMTDMPILTTDDPQDPEPLRKVHDMMDGIADPAMAHVMPDRLHAIQWALDQCQPGDSLLIIGGHNRRPSKKTAQYPPDAATARYWLHESQNSHEFDWVLPRR